MPDWMLNLAAFVTLFLFFMVATISALGAFDAWRRKCRPRGPDVGLAVFVEDPTCCDDGCDECGAPMVLPPIEDDPVAHRLGLVGDPVQRMLALMSSGAPYVGYGSTIVHHVCLVDRRDGRAPCAECAPILAGVS